MSSVAMPQEGPLLLTLEEVSRLVSHGHDPAETLGNIVRLIQHRFATNVCSVYLLEQDRGELVLGATVGLEQAGVGHVRMRLDEGLTGLVAQSMAPVMVDEATQHPRFKYFPEAGEDPYHSFLGVPLIEAGVVQGVLVVQTVEPRPFSPDEIRMLVTVASQLTPLVGGARFLGHVAAVRAGRAPLPRSQVPVVPAMLEGRPLSAGAGCGRVYISDGFDVGRSATEPLDVDRVGEQDRLAHAVDAARLEITRLSQRISELVGVDHGAILQAQLMILQDRTIERDLQDRLAEGHTSEAALSRVLDKYVEAFRKLTNPMFRERIFDIKDVFRRILWHLLPGQTPAEKAGGERIVLVAHEASVLDLLSVEPEHLAAIAVEHGGPQSHAAILARSLGVPMVGQVPGLVERVRAGQYVRVDGTTGRVALDASPEIVPTLVASNGTSTRAARTPHTAADHPALPRIEANINLLGEVDRAVALGIEGVGLYRTEFLFLARRTLPTEEEQVRLYRKLLTALKGRPASIRTFDLRPDKLAQIVHLGSEGSQSFDWRRVLDSPLLQRLFKDQVRAILRASTCGPARLLVPHVTQSETLDLVVDTIAQARQELDREGLEHAQKIPLGIMIEAAAAIPMMETWADRVDFFALGTNDLVASSLGHDRDDPSETRRSDPLHPGILRLIRDGVRAAHEARRPVSVCGEMAADPAGAMVLAALGVDTLSVAVHRLSIARRALDDLAPEELGDLADRLLLMRTADQVRKLLPSCSVL